MTVCPSCGRDSPPEFSFCPGCGTRLSAESHVLAEGRKVVTILCCDLVSYTSHSEAADHELIDELLRRYNALAKRLVVGHGGVVEKFIGDAVLAVFGFPAAHDDDAERAVRAALKLAAAAGEMAWPNGDLVQVRIGVNSGETYVHLGVDPASGETFLTGDAVNTAARLQTAAAVGTVVVGESHTFRGGIDWLRDCGVEVIDWRTGERRSSTKADLADVTRITPESYITMTRENAPGKLNIEEEDSDGGDADDRSDD